MQRTTGLHIPATPTPAAPDAPPLAADILTPAGAFLAPYLPKEPYLIPAWFGCLAWALQEPDILTAFRADTGLTWTPGRTPLERMIDDATGADAAFIAAFAAWMNHNVWGEVEAIPPPPTEDHTHG
jgi:hypothetical protein